MLIWVSYRIIYGLARIQNFRHAWDGSVTIFTSDDVMGDNHCCISSRVTKIVIFCLIRYFISGTLKNNQRSFISPGRQGPSFWLSIVTLPQLICGVTRTRRRFSHTRILARSWSSLVNNNCEYQFPATRYWRLNVQENSAIYWLWIALDNIQNSI